jgi:hypothetical protein
MSTELCTTVTGTPAGRVRRASSATLSDTAIASAQRRESSRSRRDEAGRIPM